MQLSHEQITDALLLTAEQTGASVKLGEAMDFMRLAITQPDHPEDFTTAAITAASAIMDAWGECFGLIHDTDDDVQTWGDAYRVKCIAAGMVDVP